MSKAGPMRSQQQARATIPQLSEEVTQLEVQLLRERERATSLAQRLETLRVRGKQLEAGLQRNREEAAERQREVEDRIHKTAQQVRSLMELEALQCLPASQPGGRASEASLEVRDEALLDVSPAGSKELLVGAVQLWQEDQPSRVNIDAHATASEKLRPNRSRSVPPWSAPSAGDAPADGTGPGRPRVQRAPSAVVTQLATAPMPKRATSADRAAAKKSARSRQDVTPCPGGSVCAKKPLRR